MRFAKSLTVVLAVLLTLMTLPWNALAAGTTQISVKMPETVEAGGQFAATIDLQNNTGWAALQFEVTYDTTKMKLLDVAMNEEIESKYTWFSFNEGEPGKLSVSSMYNDAAPTQKESGNITTNGTWVTMTFAVADSVADGTEIAVSARLVTMVNAMIEKQLEPATFTGKAKVGTLSAEAKKTQPSVTGGAVVSGAVTGETGHFGTATNGAGKVTQSTKSVPTVGTTMVTNAAGQTEIVTFTSPVQPQSDRNNDPGTWLWILIGALVIAGVTVMAVLITRRKK